MRNCSCCCYRLSIIVFIQLQMLSLCNHKVSMYTVTNTTHHSTSSSLDGNTHNSNFLHYSMCTESINSFLLHIIECLLAKLHYDYQSLWNTSNLTNDVLSHSSCTCVLGFICSLYHNRYILLCSEEYENTLCSYSKPVHS